MMKKIVHALETLKELGLRFGNRGDDGRTYVDYRRHHGELSEIRSVKSKHGCVREGRK